MARCYLPTPAKCASPACRSQDTRVYSGSSPGLNDRVTINLCVQHTELAKADGWDLEPQKPCKAV